MDIKFLVKIKFKKPNKNGPRSKKKIKNIELHLIGGLQSNKAKDAVTLFEYIHSVDSLKLIKELAKAEAKLAIKRKYFIQVNIGEEKQKSGVLEKNLPTLFEECGLHKLHVVGLMCIPPINLDPLPFFLKLKKLNEQLELSMMSMGMSSDFKEAAKLGSTHLRIGSKIFGNRSIQ